LLEKWRSGWIRIGCVCRSIEEERKNELSSKSSRRIEIVHHFKIVSLTMDEMLRRSVELNLDERV